VDAATAVDVVAATAVVTAVGAADAFDDDDGGQLGRAVHVTPRSGLAGVAGTTSPEPGVELTTLDNGVRVVTERMPEARSVSIGFWAGVGSRDESDELAGASHFLEHLLFKGTDRRSAREIAVAVDAVGGEMNAFTTREHTAYYTRLPVAELDFGLDLLTDVVAGPAFRPPEVDAEREVILEEILMNDDAPDDVVHTRLLESVFPDHPLGRETLGSETTVEHMERDAIAAFHAHWYRPANLVVAAAGALEHAQVVERIASFLPDAEVGARPERSAPTRPPESLSVVHRPTEQAHVAMAWRGIAQREPDRYALSVANQILGGGMSSRLFQEVREERGLAYTVFTAPSSYADTGVLVLYAGTAPARLGELLDVVADVIDGVLADGITDAELDVAKGYLEGATLLGLEDSGSRMARLGAGLTSRGEIIPVAEHLERTREVTAADVHRVLQRVLGAPGSLSIVGPFQDDEPVLVGAVERLARRAR
jgi:predicted Zn-dependent peptidase